MTIADLIAQTIAQHISNPRVISYAPTKLNEVQGRFVSSNRVYNFVLDKQGISYSPAGRQDSLLFSALYLERLDAARKPKIGNDKCNAGKSYQCGKICLGNRRKCHKGVRDVNDARRIASILAGTNEKLKGSLEGSDKAIARGKALFEARGNREANPKTQNIQPDKNLQKLGKLSKPVRSLTVSDYPLGGNKRGEMRFWVESHPKKGERIVRQSAGNKPKYSTYADKYAIATGENGRTYFVSHTKNGDYSERKVSTHDFKDAPPDYYKEINVPKGEFEKFVNQAK